MTSNLSPIICNDTDYYTHWNRDGRLFRIDTNLTPAQLYPPGDEGGCSWCGVRPRAGLWLIPATDHDERFCSMACFDADTEDCWDHDPLTPATLQAVLGFEQQIATALTGDTTQ